MADEPKREGAEKGLSAGILAVVFLIWVAICAVFFSLGFVVGYNELSSKPLSMTGQISVPSAVAPVLNPPRQTSNSQAKESKPSPPPDSASLGARNRDDLDLLMTPDSSSNAAKNSKPAPPDAPGQSNASSPPAGAAPGEVGMGYTVQVDALRAKQDAEAIVKILKARHYPVFLVAPQYSNAKDNLYRVQVGPFTTREDAEKVRARLSKEGFNPFIRR